MEAQSKLEEIRSNLNRLRQDPNTKRRFPKKLWDSIIQMAKIYPHNDLCRELGIHPVYLKRKIQQITKNSLAIENALEFQEVALSAPSNNLVTIQLSNDKLKATIQGPVCCLDFLPQLFGG